MESSLPSEFVQIVEVVTAESEMVKIELTEIESPKSEIKISSEKNILRCIPRNVPEL